MNGYYHSAHEPFVPAYKRSELDVEALPDVVRTFEWFGYWQRREPFESSVLGHPLLLVKPKVVKIFEEYKVRRVHFEPIRLLDR